jgi:hypothetical protein
MTATKAQTDKLVKAEYRERVRIGGTRTGMKRGDGLGRIDVQKTVWSYGMGYAEPIQGEERRDEKKRRIHRREGEVTPDNEGGSIKRNGTLKKTLKTKPSRKLKRLRCDSEW